MSAAQLTDSQVARPSDESDHRGPLDRALMWQLTGTTWSNFNKSDR